MFEVLAQQSGWQQNAQKAAENGGGLLEAGVGLFNTAVNSQYGWVIGVFILFLLARWAWRRVS